MVKYLKLNIKCIFEKIGKELQYEIKLEQIKIVDIT